MNRRNFLAAMAGVTASAALATGAGPQAVQPFREYSPAGLTLLGQRDRIADGLNAVIEAGGDSTSAEYRAGVEQMRAIEQQLIALENRP